MSEIHLQNLKQEGIAVICGVNPRNPKNIIGYRPCVGMVGGTIYFRGLFGATVKKDVKLVDPDSSGLGMAKTNMKPFLEAIDRQAHYNELTKSSDDWKKLLHIHRRKSAEENGSGYPFLISEKNVG